MITNTKLKHPVIEVFGPTLQGEGVLVGMPVHFVRFGGCDYSCSWCDTKYAVIPSEVKKNSTMMSDEAILEALEALSGAPQWVVLSGGNPALQNLDGLCDQLHEQGYNVTIETQGTVYRKWLDKVDSVTVSPKPPSSANVTTMEEVDAFRNSFSDDGALSYKVVVFDQHDLEYLSLLVEHLDGEYPVFLSVGTDVENDTALDLCNKWRDWAEYVSRSTALSSVRVLAQCHVLLWGQKRGV